MKEERKEGGTEIWKRKEVYIKRERRGESEER